jgi:CBS domain-containing protein
MKARDILAIKGMALFTIGPDNKLREALAIMSDRDVGSLVCLEHGRMVGMLTFSEVFKAIHANGAAWGSVRVAEIMVHDPLYGTGDTMVDDLRRLMVSNHIRYLPVMDGSTLLGVMSFHDVAKAVLEEQGFENQMLKAYIRDWPEEQVAQ